MLTKALIIFISLDILFGTIFVYADLNMLHLGILKAQEIDSSSYSKHCFGFYSGVKKIPVHEGEAIFMNMSDIYSLDLCEESPPPEVRGTRAFADKDGNCSLIERAADLSAAGAYSSVFVGDGWKNFMNASNMSDMGFITNKSYHQILEMGSVVIGTYSSVEEHEFFMYYTLVVIWIMAQFSIFVGGLRSGIVRHRLYLSEQERLRETGLPEAPTTQSVLPHEESSLNLSPKIIVLLVSLMCVFLVGLWALLDYLVYLIIAVFCLASIFAIYSCFEPMVLKIPCGTCRTPYFNLYVVRGVLEVRQILLLLVAIALPVVWVIFRKEPYAWILQDFLGIAFCINMMVRIRLPNLMICTLLLCLLVFYDIFFVFITPFITASGTSIMVDVAKGGNSSEELPMVFKVPYFVYPEVYDVCKIRNYSLLGFGDILVPGLLISYVHSFDLRADTPCRLYFTVTTTAYGCGLLLTFLCLYLMQGAQPALFYLVPAILVPTVIIAAARGELSAMWSDKLVKNKSTGDVASEDADNAVGVGLPASPFLSNSNGNSGALLDSTDEAGRYNNSMDSDNRSSCTNTSTEALNKKLPDEV